MAICERTLQDRINTDHEAIFGQSITCLRVEERIDFTSHGQVVVCWSEEEVTAAQLRLLKDYVDYHADELYADWRQWDLSQIGTAVSWRRPSGFSDAGTRRCGHARTSPSAMHSTS